MTLIPGRKRGLVITELEGFPQNTAQFLRADGVFAVPSGGAGGGDVTGPASAVSADVAVFSGASGKAIADSGVAIANVVLTTDSRLSNARTPTAHHGSHESGGSDPVALAESQITGLVADLAARVLTSDSRLSDARTPTAHATSHKGGGSDAIKLDELAAPTDVTTLNASTTAHGLLKKLSNVATEFLNGQGNFATLVGGLATEQSTSATGTQNDFDLTAHLTYLRCDGAAAVFTGFKVMGAAPAAGDRVVIDNIGTGTIKIAHQDTGSTAAYRAITASTAGQIVGVGGRLFGIYDGTTSRWRVTLIDPGAPIAVAFDATHYTANGAQTWTVASGDQETRMYIQRGKVLTYFFVINTTTVGGTPNNRLILALPAGFTVTRQIRGIVQLFDNNVGTPGQCTVSAAGTTILFGRIDNLNFAAATDATYVLGQAQFEVD
jgi:hypothetical protein